MWGLLGLKGSVGDGEGATNGILSRMDNDFIEQDIITNWVMDMIDKISNV